MCFRILSDLPLVVLVSMPLSAVLEQVREKSARMSAGMSQRFLSSIFETHRMILGLLVFF